MTRHPPTLPLPLRRRLGRAARRVFGVELGSGGVSRAGAAGQGDAGELVDWAFVSPEAMTELLSAAVELAGSSTVMTWLATLPDDERVMLRRSGFVEHSTPAVERHRPGLLVQSLEGANARVSVASRRERPTWSYRPVDGDNF